MRYRIALALVAGITATATAQDRSNRANFALADKFSAAALRPVVYTSAVNPRWLGQSDSLCYNWKDHSGSAFYIVVPTTKTKRTLFDQEKLAAQLSSLSHKAHDPQNLPFTTLSFSKDRKTFEFTADSSRWEWTLASETLKRLGPAVAAGAGAGRGGRGGQGGGGGAPPAADADSISTLAITRGGLVQLPA